MRIGPQRPVKAAAIVAPQDYRVEALITGLSFPAAIAFGSGGELYLAESGGVPGFLVSVPRVIRVDPDRSVTEIGRLDNPIVGLVYRQGELLIGEDGPSPRILRVTAEGEVRVAVEGLPGGGDYGLSNLALDSHGALLFGLGTRTNSGVVGLDNVARGWVDRHPDRADVAGTDVELAGVNYVTSQPTAAGSARLVTGSFRPFGHRCEPGHVLKGQARCGGAIYRLAPDSTEPERLAWGLRNPIGVGLGPEGRLFATEEGMEERGSRPIADAPDQFWEIQPGGYYGWPDFAGGVPVTEARFRLPGHPPPRRLLQNPPGLAGLPAASFAPRSGVGRFDFCFSENFGFAGDALVALSGGWSVPAFPVSDDATAGHRVVRVNPKTGEISDFLVNRQGAPASSGNTGGLERPMDVRFDPSGEILYVVDFGEVRISRDRGPAPLGGTGVVWRITRSRTLVTVPDRPQRGKKSSEEVSTEPETEPQDGAEEAIEESGEPEGGADQVEPADEISEVESVPSPPAEETEGADAPASRTAPPGLEAEKDEAAGEPDEPAEPETLKAHAAEAEAASAGAGVDEPEPEASAAPGDGEDADAMTTAPAGEPAADAGEAQATESPEQPGEQPSEPTTGEDTKRGAD
jgi:glucose/arabinose dehydrogenase